MHLSSTLVQLLNLVPFIISETSAHPTAADHSSELKHRQTSGTFPITGITSSGVQPRLEIRQLASEQPDAFNVYILGLQRFQQTDQSDPLSWYGIAGIHGRPYVAWDGVNSPLGLPGNPGYCHHVSNLILPWHRPYVALYEQVLFQHINDAVNEFPDDGTRARYASAAANWRAPYWDWAAAPSSGGSTFPSMLTTPTIEVTTPSGVETIANPLFSYQFHPLSTEDFYWTPFILWNQTMRNPNTLNSDAVSQNGDVADTLDNLRENIMSRVYNLMTTYDNFTEFETYAWQSSSNSGTDSLESVHDLIHGVTGGDGHMTYLDYSAFDPLFMLHHAMVDRLFAIWQALHPDSYVEPMVSNEQTFTTAVGQTLDGATPMDPFHSDVNGDKWTADGVRGIEQFGYTYPELAGNPDQSSIRTAVNRLYGSTSTSQLMQLTTLSTASTSAANSTTYETYAADIVSRKFAVGGSYAIYVFFGDAPADAAAWSTAANLVGMHGVFTGKTSHALEDVNVRGSVPLTTALLEKLQSGELKSMDIETVQSYLRQNLHWRAGRFDGTPIDNADLSDLSLTVVATQVKPAQASDQFPVLGNAVSLDTYVLTPSS